VCSIHVLELNTGDFSVKHIFTESAAHAIIFYVHKTYSVVML